MSEKELPTNGLTQLLSEPMIKLLSNVGFSVVIALLLFWFQQQNQQFIYEIVRSEQAERREQGKVLEKATQLLQQLVEKVERLDKK